MTNRLAGKVCIITGTGGSMGRAAALIFAREDESMEFARTRFHPA